ncbi:MAG: DNA repair protein RecO [Lachnospiraceae bacterium]|nr:DNA repair protein RecO [Lachnospiraceae bacterium]
MQDQVVVTGIVIKQAPVGESDRRVTILTNSRGKISAFARGARKPNSRFAATARPFCFGTFKLYEGRDAYNIADAEISNYFENLLTDIEGSCYAAYFGEVVDYYCRENNDERDMMKLFYQGLCAISFEGITNRLVKCIFEIKSIMINGEYPGIPNSMKLSDTAIYTLDYIYNTLPEKVFSFNLDNEVLEEIERVAGRLRKSVIDHHFKSLEILEAMI